MYYSHAYSHERMWEIVPARLAEAMERASVNQSELAEAVGMRQPSIGRLLSGDTKTTKAIEAIAEFLGTTPAYLRGQADEIEGEGSVPMLPRRSRSGEVLHIAEIDLAYGMGSSFLEDDGQIGAETMPFPAKWVRHFTRSPASELFFARGAGDSMMPTIHDADIILIDRSQNTLRLADQIWAFAFGDFGMIKRLRPRPDGSIAILSDNPVVPEDRAVDGELHIIGRVVAVQKKL